MVFEYGGVDILDIANIFPVNVNRGAVQTNVSSVQVGDIGEFFSRKQLGRRVVTFKFALVDNDLERRFYSLRKIRDWCAGSELKPLRMDCERGGYLNAVCATEIDPWKQNRVETIALQFIAPDPRFIDNSEEVYPDIARPVSVEKSEPPILRIEQGIDAGLDDASWSVNGAEIRLTGLVGTGRLVIDLSDQRQAITLNGYSVASALTFDSSIENFAFKRGYNRIACTGGAGGTLYVRERWM